MIKKSALILTCTGLFSTNAYATYSIIAIDSEHNKTGAVLGTCLVNPKDSSNYKITLLDKTNVIVPGSGIFNAQGVLYYNEDILYYAGNLLSFQNNANSIINAITTSGSTLGIPYRQFSTLAQDGLMVSSASYDGENLNTLYGSKKGQVGSIYYVISGNRLLPGTLEFLEQSFRNATGVLEAKFLNTLETMANNRAYGDSSCKDTSGGSTTNAYVKVSKNADLRSTRSSIETVEFEYVEGVRQNDAITGLREMVRKYKSHSDYMPMQKLSDTQSFTTKRYSSSTSEKVFFTIPYIYNQGDVKTAPQESTTSENRYSVIEAFTLHPTSAFTLPVVLRASNLDENGNEHEMNSLQSGRLKISFYGDDNKNLPTGIYNIPLNIIVKSSDPTKRERRLSVSIQITIMNEVITLSSKKAIGTFAAGTADWNGTYQAADNICNDSPQLSESAKLTFGKFKFKALISARANIVFPGITYRRGGPWGDGLNTVINKNASSSGNELVFNSSQTGMITPWSDRAWWGTTDNRWDCNRWSENYGGWVGANMDTGQKGIQSIDQQWCDMSHYLVCVSTGEVDGY